MSVDPRRTSPIMRWWCECGQVLCGLYRQCPHCGRWPAPAPAPEGGNWWDPDDEGLCIWAAYQPKGAANFAASLVDLSGNGNNATDPGGAGTPAWDAVNGWGFDGAQSYLRTGYTPASKSQSALVQFTNGVAGTNKYIFGVRDTTVGLHHFFLGPSWSSGTNQAIYANCGQVAPTPIYLSGNTAVAGGQGYRDGVPHGGAIGGVFGGCGFECYLGGRNQNGGLNGPWNCDVQAAAIYDCTLTAVQMAAVAAAMAAL